jgi:hypothetical protein
VQGVTDAEKYASQRRTINRFPTGKYLFPKVHIDHHLVWRTIEA